MVKRSNVLYRFFYCGGGGGTFIIPGGGGTFIIPGGGGAFIVPGGGATPGGGIANPPTGAKPPIMGGGGIPPIIPGGGGGMPTIPGGGGGKPIMPPIAAGVLEGPALNNVCGRTIVGRSIDCASKRSACDP
jgi:hypothetical protein